MEADADDNARASQTGLFFASCELVLQHSKSLSNTGKLPVKSERLVTSCLSPVSDPSPKLTSGSGKPADFTRLWHKASA